MHWKLMSSRGCADSPAPLCQIIKSGKKTGTPFYGLGTAQHILQNTLDRYSIEIKFHYHDLSSWGW